MEAGVTSVTPSRFRATCVCVTPTAPPLWALDRRARTASGTGVTLLAGDDLRYVASRLGEVLGDLALSGSQLRRRVLADLPARANVSELVKPACALLMSFCQAVIALVGSSAAV